MSDNMNTSQAQQWPIHLDVAGTAEYLNITQRQVRNLITKRMIPHAKIGGLVRFNRAELDKWVASNSRTLNGAR